MLTVLPFEGEEEAVELANGVDFGLSANIWTRDVGRMLRMAERLDSGTIWGNTTRLLHPALPFGGFKESGSATRPARARFRQYTAEARLDLYGEDRQGPQWDDR